MTTIRASLPTRIFLMVFFIASLFALPWLKPQWFSGLWLWVYGIVAFVVYLDIILTRVTLYDDRIVTIKNFRRQQFFREEIESVTWEKGCSASIKLKNGQWKNLPEVGRGGNIGLANTVRSWLKKRHSGPPVGGG